MSNTVIEWIDSAILSQNPEIRSRNSFVLNNRDKSVMEIAGLYLGVPYEELGHFTFEVAKDLNLDFSGTGIELGAGTSAVSNILASNFHKIDKIYAVEIVPEIVKSVQTKLIELSGNQDKVVSVIGSFSELKLPDDSVDFIIEYDSLHHADDLDAVLSECFRVLKKGGKLVAFDRINPDALSNEQRDFMLDVEYDEAFKIRYGMQLEEKLTRRQNGEHEITHTEWSAAFVKAGFEVREFTIYHRKSLRAFILALLSWIPFKLRKKYNFYPMLIRSPVSLFFLYIYPWCSRSGRYRRLKAAFSSRRAPMNRGVYVITK